MAQDEGKSSWVCIPDELWLHNCASISLKSRGTSYSVCMLMFHPGPSSFCVYRTYSRKASPPPLTIAPLANKDWRNSSRSSKTHVASTSSNPNRASSSRQMYLPSGAQHPSNASSTEPVVTREVSSTDATGGLILATSRITAPAEGSVGQDAKNEVDEANVQVEVTPLTLEERAMKALLGGDDGDDEERELEAIPTAGNNRQMMISEEEAFRRDVETRPEEVSHRKTLHLLSLSKMSLSSGNLDQHIKINSASLFTPPAPRSRPSTITSASPSHLSVLLS